MSLRLTLSIMSTILLLTGCHTASNQSIPVVTHFNTEAYLGHWFEIARLDNRFEKGLDHVSAQYSLRTDGGINVLNRGFDPVTKQWQATTGRGYFIDSPTKGALKITFFWPFYGAYNVIAIDPEYRYALVCGDDKKYLWILSRTPEIDQKTKNQFLTLAQHYGFNTDQLIWVNQQ